MLIAILIILILILTIQILGFFILSAVCIHTADIEKIVDTIKDYSKVRVIGEDKKSQ